MKTTGELRIELSKCFELAKNGALSGDALRGVVGCANQINMSIQSEIKARTQLQREGLLPSSFGDLPLGAFDNVQKNKS